MTLRKLASDIAAMEGKKSEVSIGDIREILSCICALETANIINRTPEDGPFKALSNDVIKRIDRYVDKVNKIKNKK